MRVIASHNGLNAALRAYDLLRQGRSPLEACVEGVSLVEDDPDEHSVGYGGIPNEDGVVELDAAVMDGRTRRGAGVAGLRNVRYPSRVAKLLMEQTGRVLVVGDGALAFARATALPRRIFSARKPGASGCIGSGRTATPTTGDRRRRPSMPMCKSGSIDIIVRRTCRGLPEIWAR
jgi:isoaspartyl peptidase/L-asparaginase-like protein (Ntn-hydrolase superfamily)